MSSIWTLFLEFGLDVSAFIYCDWNTSNITSFIYLPWKIEATNYEVTSSTRLCVVVR
jgi:hypothetical protein